MSEFSITKIPASLLLEVTEIVTVYSVKLTKNKDLVMLTAASGATKNMTKAEFVGQHFCNLNGKEVKLISMRAGKEYIVCHIVNKHSFAVKVPRNNHESTIIISDNNKITAGKVLVVEEQKLVANEDGTFDLSKGHIMSETIFRKTCILRSVSDELLTKLHNNTAEAVDNSAHNDALLNVETKQQVVQQPQQPVQPVQQQPVQPVQQQSVQQPAQTAQQPVQKGTVVAIGKDRANRFVCYFVLVNDSLYEYTKEQLINLCDNNLITNAMAVRTNDKVFLRGNGCRLEDLPIKLV